MNDARGTRENARVRCIFETCDPAAQRLRRPIENAVDQNRTAAETIRRFSTNFEKIACVHNRRGTERNTIGGSPLSKNSCKPSGIVPRSAMPRRKNRKPVRTASAGQSGWRVPRTFENSTR